MTKQVYWKCADCNSIIDDTNMRQNPHFTGEWCGVCFVYNPEVILAYA